MALAYHHEHARLHGTHRFWPILGAIIAFLLVMLSAKPIG
jgi:hypothetical protein